MACWRAARRPERLIASPKDELKSRSSISATANEVENYPLLELERRPPIGESFVGRGLTPEVLPQVHRHVVAGVAGRRGWHPQSRSAKQSTHGWRRAGRGRQLFQEIRMPAFVDQTQEVDGFAPDLVVDEEREGFGTPARKAVRANVVTSSSPDDLRALTRHAFAKGTGQSR